MVLRRVDIVQLRPLNGAHFLGGGCVGGFYRVFSLPLPPPRGLTASYFLWVKFSPLTPVGGTRPPEPPNGSLPQSPFFLRLPRCPIPYVPPLVLCWLNMKPENAAAVLLEGAERIIKGKRTFLELLIAAVFAGGHVLIEDNPGLGKTTVAKTLTKLIDGGKKGLVFKRIQFTPDLLPYDITGVDVFDPKSLKFRFIPGPVLANIVLADEINRATPKVQSALLEVMAERQVTIGQATHRPPEPFLVIATENPIESEGTFPLPAAQLDRFMLKLSMGYPDRTAELAILDENPAEAGLAKLEPVLRLTDFMAAKKAAAAVFCHQALKEAIADIVRDTRIHKGFSLGASPRAALHLLDAAKGLALVRGRTYVIDEDLSTLAAPVLAHRLRLRDPRAAGDKFIREICLARIDGIKTE